MKLFFMSLCMSFIIMMSYLILSKISSYNDLNKMSPFECGFEPMSNNRNLFSMRFFKITLIFLIFDIEIILVLPFPLIMNMSNNFIMSFLIISIIIILGLFYEWIKGSLNWIK